MCAGPSSTTSATVSGRPPRSRRSASDARTEHDASERSVSGEDLERYETEIELALYREYRDVLPMFSYVVETERRFYLANDVQVTPKQDGAQTYFELELHDAWVWDMYRPARFVSSVRVLSFKDVNVEKLDRKDVQIEEFASKDT